MPRLKIRKDELDVKELDEAEYDDKDLEYADYEGEDPPGKILLTMYVKKLWWTYTQEKDDGTGGDPMLKVLSVADDRAGEFEGWPGWDNVPLTKATKFRWKPFLDALGLDLKTVFGKTYVDEDGYSDNLGTPVERIGDWEPGEDNDSAYLQVRTKRERYNGEWSTKIAKYFPYPSDDEEEEPEEEPKPTRKPAKAASKPSSRRRRTEPEPEPEPEDEDDIDPDDVEDEDVEPEEIEEEEEEEEQPRRPARRASAGRGRAGGTPARDRGKASASATTATSRGKGRGGAKRGAPVGDDDPPF